MRLCENRSEKEAKKWTFEELTLELTRQKLRIPRAIVDWVSEDKETAKWACLRQHATDWTGTHLLRAFRKENEHWIEVDVKEVVEEMADYLSKSLSVKRIMMEVLVNLEVDRFFDLRDRICKKPKVTVGVQKGSCVYLYIRGKKGRPTALQITE